MSALPKWDLTHLYKTPQAIELQQDLNWAKNEAKAIASDAQGKLTHIIKTPKALFAIIQRYEKLDDVLGRIMSYAGLLYADNNADPQIAKFYGDMSEQITTLSTDLIFFSLELNELSEESIANALKDPHLAHYAPWLKDLRLEKPYQLDAKLEQLFSEKSQTGAASWNRLFDETMTKLKFSVDGKILALEPTLAMLQDKDSAKREMASHAIAKTLKDNISLFALITNVLAKDKDIADTWRGFKDVAASRNLSNRVEDEVVNALIASVEDAYPRISHRYYKLKAKWFGKDKLQSWDRNAPLPFAPPREFSWNEAKDTVLDAYNGFSPKIAQVTKRFFDENWIDAQVREGKSSGAFSHPTTPSAHPYILMNYLGKPRDVMTLAHELGHGVHQVLAGKQGALMAPTPLTLAETASVFGEMLTFKSLLAKAKNPLERKALLAGKVEDMINTVVRQIAFYSFERKLHLARKNGELTADDICAIWMSVQTNSLGEAIEFKEGYETFWAYIPHFIHSPFYVYAYAFGDCLVNALYAVYEKSNEGFAQKYLHMLEAGGTKHHSELLAPFGLNASDKSFWAAGLKVIEDMIDELEAME